MQRRIKFTHTGHSHLLGNFSAGDLFTGSPEACRHFVEEARCAEWADPPPPPPESVQAPAPELTGEAIQAALQAAAPAEEATAPAPAEQAAAPAEEATAPAPAEQAEQATAPTPATAPAPAEQAEQATAAAPAAARAPRAPRNR